MSGWFLTQIAIEGFRGINNQGDPLALKFKTDKVNSVFATNGMGKSSIFDALSYAFTGAIPKLKQLPASEGGESYYLNRFHPASHGTVSLTLSPEAGGADVIVTTTRHDNGSRTVTTSDGSDGEALLRELNREFVLLDARTFQNFIEHKPLDRGRAFAGLLGLGPYSTLRQSLQSVNNTRAFNNHFGTTAATAEKSRAELELTTASNAVTEAYKALVGEDLQPTTPENDLMTKAHAALANIALIKSECVEKAFVDISPDDCVTLVRDAEGGKDRDRLAQVIRAEAAFDEALKKVPSEDDGKKLVELATAYDEALEKTRGDDFLKLFRLTAKILGADEWSEKGRCPACEHDGGQPLLEHINAKAAQFDLVTQAAEAIRIEWTARGWTNLTALEHLTREDGEGVFVQPASSKITSGGFTAVLANGFVTAVSTASSRGQLALQAAQTEKLQLEQKLPPSLVAVTEKIEAARRLQKALKDRSDAIASRTTMMAKIERTTRLKQFLDAVSSGFSDAEANAATRRLAAVEPICQTLFSKIMHLGVVPAIAKPAGSEELSISLASFHTLTNLSAPSLLSESYRNAFAISVYLAAASLFGGAAKFLVLDDVTSSFDGGHQYHLMEAMRSSFARPGIPNGPQVILLSHDTLLEKYFNTQMNAGIWWHQRIQGSPRTAVLPQNNAVNRLRDSITNMLNAGNAIDGGAMMRDYLEYRLEEVIAKVAIPVPINVAISDDKRLASAFLEAIKDGVKLHKAANSLILEAAQEAGLNTAMMTIVGNYLAHWNTGQTALFTPPALLGVVQAIDDFVDCFKYEPAPGQQKRFYKNLASK